ncbi:MAG: alpha/beta hydrolase, partial [Chloroflexota bacterium]
MSAIIIDDKIVHYEVLGRGKPIVFLHGWVGSWRYWIPTMQAASTTFRAYALDLWGFGDSAKESNHYTLEKQTELLDEFLNRMGIGKVAIVGHGLGAVVAMLYASKHAFVVDRIMGISLPLEKMGLIEKLTDETPTELVNRLVEQTPATEPARSDAPKTDKLAIKISLEDMKLINLLDVSKLLGTAALLVHGQKDPVIGTPE